MASALLLLGAGYLRDEPTVPLPSSSSPPPPPPPFACSDLAVRTVLTEGACKNVRYPENNCSNFFYHNGPHIDPDKDRWRLCVAPSGPENDVCEGILLTGCWPPPPPLPNSPPPPPLGCAAGAPACPPGFYEMPSPGGCRDNFCGTGLYDAFKGLDTESKCAALSTEPLGALASPRARVLTFRCVSRRGGVSPQGLVQGVRVVSAAPCAATVGGALRAASRLSSAGGGGLW